MRLAAVFAVMVAALAPRAAQAQMCSLGVSGPQPYSPAFDAPPSPRAAAEVQQIISVLCPGGCGRVELVSNQSTANASATAMGMGQTMISYSPQFLTRIEQQYGAGATFGILAHEFGHHIDFHTTAPWMNTSWSRELKADAWAGCALARVGGSTAQIEASLQAIAAFPSPSHPSWQQRVPAVRTGFANCGGQWLGRWGGGSPPAQYASVCQTQFGQCPLGPGTPVGAPCSCTGMSQFGPVTHPGQAR